MGKYNDFTNSINEYENENNITILENEEYSNLCDMVINGHISIKEFEIKSESLMNESLFLNIPQNILIESIDSDGNLITENLKDNLKNLKNNFSKTLNNVKKVSVDFVKKAYNILLGFVKSAIKKIFGTKLSEKVLSIVNNILGKILNYIERFKTWLEKKKNSKIYKMIIKIFFGVSISSGAGYAASQMGAPVFATLLARKGASKLVGKATKKFDSNILNYTEFLNEKRARLKDEDVDDIKKRMGDVPTGKRVEVGSKKPVHVPTSKQYVDDKEEQKEIQQEIQDDEVDYNQLTKELKDIYGKYAFIKNPNKDYSNVNPSEIVFETEAEEKETKDKEMDDGFEKFNKPEKSNLKKAISKVKNFILKLFKVLKNVSWMIIILQAIFYVLSWLFDPILDFIEPIFDNFKDMINKITDNVSEGESDKLALEMNKVKYENTIEQKEIIIKPKLDNSTINIVDENINLEKVVEENMESKIPEKIVVDLTSGLESEIDPNLKNEITSDINTKKEIIEELKGETENLNKEIKENIKTTEDTKDLFSFRINGEIVDVDDLDLSFDDRTYKLGEGNENIAKRFLKTNITNNIAEDMDINTTKINTSGDVEEILKNYEYTIFEKDGEKYIGYLTNKEKELY
jgi:hypothetical protein